MATLESVSAKIRGLIDAANAVTGNNDTDLTRAVNVLIAGYNQGGTGDYYRYVTFMGIDNETVEDTVTVSPKYSCSASVAPKLTKESTEDKVYAHIGWSLTPDGEVSPYVLSNITEDITLYPVFSESVRHYTVRFWDGNKLCRTQQIPYGGSSDYVYKKVGHYFQGWTPEPINVTADIDCYGAWEMASFAKDSWDQISENARAGVAANYYKVGDERQIYVPYGTAVDGATGDNIVLRVANIGTEYDLNGNAMKGMVVFAAVPLRNSKMAYRANNDKTDTYASLSYLDSDVYEYLWKVYNVLPSELTSKIRYVRKSIIRKYAHFTNTDTSEMELNLWPFSLSEVFGNGSMTGYDVFKIDGNGTNATSDARIMYHPDGTAVPWMLRDPVNFDTVHVVQTDGSIRSGQVTDDDAYVVFGFFL